MNRLGINVSVRIPGLYNRHWFVSIPLPFVRPPQPASVEQRGLGSPSHEALGG